MRIKVLFLLSLLPLFCSLTYAQRAAAVTPALQNGLSEQEVSIQLQSDKELKKQVESLENEVDLYRQDVRDTVERINGNMSHWLSLFTLIITIIVGLLGVVAPAIQAYLQNKQYEKRLEELKRQVEMINEQVEITRRQATEATEQAVLARQDKNTIKGLKYEMDEIKHQIETDLKAAKEAADRAEASRLFTEALNEDDLKKKRDLYSRSIELYPKRTSFFNRGITNSRLQDFHSAIQDFDKAIELEPKRPTSYYNRGLTKYKMKDYEKALLDYDKAIELDSSNAKYYRSRAKCYKALSGQETDSVKKQEYLTKAEADEAMAASLKNAKASQPSQE